MTSSPLHSSTMAACLHTFLYIVLLIAAAHAAPQTSDHPAVAVPGQARPGHVVTMLPYTQGQMYSLRHPMNPTAAQYFTVMDQGHLVTNTDISPLVGQSFTLHVEHELPSGLRLQTLQLNVVPSTQFEFQGQPYTGHVTENQPAGTLVQGLEALSTACQTFPPQTVFTLVVGDVDIFQLNPTDEIKGCLSLVTTQTLDREDQKSYHVTIRAQNGNQEAFAMMTIEVEDENDNVPTFHKPVFYGLIPFNAPVDTPILDLFASDPDYEDEISFQLESNDLVSLDSTTRSVIVKQQPKDRLMESYEFEVYAVDKAGAQSRAVLRIETEEGRPGISRSHRRRRRSTADIIMVVNSTATGELFTVATNPDDTNKQYSMQSDVLTVNPTTGMVTLVAGRTAGDLSPNPLSIYINETSTGDQSQRVIFVELNIVSRGLYVPIFTNEPYPIRLMVPTWIRPYEALLTLEAVDAAEFGANVRYQLETGGNDRFTVDEMTGVISTLGRAPHTCTGDPYEIAISAQVVGIPEGVETPAQVITVYCEDLDPQFFRPSYNITNNEMSTAILDVQIQAKSFFELPLTYELVALDGEALSYSIDSETGELTPLRALDYARDPLKRQEIMNVTVTEANSGYSSTTELIINLVDINNHDPEFPVECYVPNEVIVENVPINYSILEVMIVDLDSGPLGEVTFEVEEAYQDRFRIDRNADKKSGIMRSNGRLDYDFVPKHYYEFTVTARDGGVPPRNSTVMVRVPMSGVVDEAPVFTPTRQEVTVKVGANQGTLIHVIQAHDPDGSPLTFRFTGGESTQSGTRYKQYQLDPNTGFITLAESIATPQDGFEMTVEATDGRNSALKSTAQIKIVYDTVNRPPQFVNCDQYKPTIREKQPPGTRVMTVSATDPDLLTSETGQMTVEPVYQYQQPQYFSVRNLSDPVGGGVIQLWDVIADVEFDRENPLEGFTIVEGTIKYPLTLKVTDKDLRDPLSATCFFFIGIADINDHAPEFDNQIYSVTAKDDNLVPNQNLIRVFAFDRDEGINAEVRYNILNSAPLCGGQSCFQIGETTGQLWLRSTNLPGNSFDLTIEARDRGTPSMSTNVTTRVLLTDDDALLPPVWEGVQITGNRPIEKIEVSELFPMDNYLNQTYRATSPGGLQVHYSIAQGNTKEQNSQEKFAAVLDTTRNVMQIQVRSGLDYEETPWYILQIRASYLSSDLNLYSIIRVNVSLIDENDNNPRLIGQDELGKFPAAVAENTDPGALCTTIFASDLDGTFPNNKVSFYFDDAKCGNDCSKFNLNEESGQITTNVRFDRSEKDEYILYVHALDLLPGMPDRRSSTIKPVTVKITGASQNPPEFSQSSYRFTKQENWGYGTRLEQIIATSIDIENFAQYDITQGNTDRLFAVDKRDGIIVYYGLLNPDDSPYTLRYRAFDGISETFTSVVITIAPYNLFPPVFSPGIYTNQSIEELTSTGLPLYITQVQATAPSNTAITYDLAGLLYTSQRFRIASSGQSSATVSLLTSLKRDYPDGHANWQFNALATDAGAPRLTGYATINLKLQDINNNAPIFDTCCLRGYAREAMYVRQEVLEVFAEDYDAGDNARISYRILESPVNSNGAPIFSIDNSNRGLITCATFLNREQQDVYYVTVEAKDNPTQPQEALTSTATVTIIVADANTHPPEFQVSSFYFTVPESRAVGDVVGFVSAQDADLEYNAQRTYSIVGGNPMFYMDSIYQAGTGAIKVKEPLNFEAMRDPNVTFTVRVDGPPGSGESDSVPVLVEVTNVNDMAPIITMSRTPIPVQEIVAIGTKVTSVTARDEDAGAKQEFRYFVDYENSDPHQFYTIEGDGTSTGTLRVRNQLNWEPPQGLQEVAISVVDSGWPPQTGTGTIHIQIIDFNTHAPQLEVPTDMLVVRNQESIGTVIATLSITDKDSPENGPPFQVPQCQQTQPIYGCTMFTLQNDPNDAYKVQIKTRSTTYSRESLGFSAFTIPVVLTDTPENGRGDPLTSTTTVTVVIADTNSHQHRPGVKEITVFNYNMLFENIYIGHVYAEDEDDWDRHEKVFTIVEPAPTQFELRDYGDIYMKEDVGPGKYTFQVSVNDPRWSQVVSTVNVDVIALNDSAVENSGSIRLQGVTAEEFVAGGRDSKLTKLQGRLAADLNTRFENVQIFTVYTVPDLVKTIDVRYAAHGSPYYRSVRLNDAVNNNKAAIEQLIGPGVRIVMSPVIECPNKICYDMGCSNVLNTTADPLLVNANATSLVGVTSYVVAVCGCEARNFADLPDNPQDCNAVSCLNGGTCHETFGDVFCECPTGFDGPRCQQLRHSFNGGGWAWYPTLEQCDDDILSLQFATRLANSLLLYNGPQNTQELGDFIALELANGYPVLRYNFGGGVGSLEINGRNSQGQKTLNALNDGNWHTLQVLKQGMNLSLVVDYCAVAEIIEDIDNSYSDRAACEAKTILRGDWTILSLTTPLELGGRRYNTPGLGITNQGFDGCIKDLQHNGILYDLHVGQVGLHQSTADGCPGQDTICASCPVNSTCTAGLVGTAVCSCNPGYRGDDCATETQEKNFESDQSFMEWNLTSNYNSSIPRDSSTLHLMFRTRRTDGLIFSASSFTTLERMWIEIINSHLTVRCDLGSDDRLLTLSHVNASDGTWHSVMFFRQGNQMVLKMDSGEGRYCNESFVRDEHRLISLVGQEIVAGADVVYKRFHNGPTISNSFSDSCLDDVRHNDNWFPMIKSQNNQYASLWKDEATTEGCNSSACAGVSCPLPYECRDAWRMPMCMCPVGSFETDPPELCFAPCDKHQCAYGECIPQPDGSYICDCFEGYSGDMCNIAAAVSPSMANSSIAIIIVCCLLLLLLLLVILAFMYRYSKQQERTKNYLMEVDDDEIRENVVFYNEEGAGEEDMLSYDITRLQKPVDHDGDSTMKGPMDDPIRRREEMPLSRNAEPMSAYPRVGPDGKFPNIGDFIGHRLGDADIDPNAPPYDSVREYQYEGSGSTAGSLSSLNSSSSGGDQDYDYLNNWGPRFSKLADLYANGNDEDDTSSV